MFILYVSHDCGMSYHPESSALHLDHLNEVCNTLDDLQLRWYVFDAVKKENVKNSKIHLSIIRTLLQYT